MFKHVKKIEVPEKKMNSFVLISRDLSAEYHIREKTADQGKTLSRGSWDFYNVQEKYGQRI